FIQGNLTLDNLRNRSRFGINNLDGDEVIVDVTTDENVEQSVKDADKEVSTANPVTTAGEVVTTASEAVTTAGGEDSVAPTILITAATTPQILKDELTLAQTLMKTKAAKPKAITTSATTTTSNVIRPKARGVVVQEPS
ncbi:hypothetical protein Tco_1181353, partial [Tanacetum coccineum]